MRSPTVSDSTLITCPYCGWEDENTSESRLNDDDDCTWECRSCEKEFDVVCNVERTFDSYKMEPDPPRGGEKKGGRNGLGTQKKRH